MFWCGKGSLCVRCWWVVSVIWCSCNLWLVWLRRVLVSWFGCDRVSFFLMVSVCVMSVVLIGCCCLSCCWF